ncbi:MAG TPA: sigma-54 dependent transcriptional regulator, partial [Vicinamibacterales bacterium]|nr:sigma-54 dependent transcriptional regulator [Vicinamibacterales bacterium]
SKTSKRKHARPASRPAGSADPVRVATPAQILIVEDKDSLRTMLRHALERQGHTVLEARDGPEAVRILLQAQPAVVLSDLRLPEGDGFAVLRASKEFDAEIPVIVMTAYGSIEDAVAAMKEGAMDFLAKPVDPDHLLLLVARALEQRRIVTENMLLKEELAVRRGAPQLVGEDPSLRKVFAGLQRAAATDTTVLLEGESGTGKELFARSLHALSSRADAPFVAINCAAIPETLLETELFGHEKGAFTGAVARKPGKFEMAHRGTLFLDEIGDLPLSLQAKILRALEERRFERVGGTASVQVDVRLVAATNQGLRAQVAARRFREDLFFRLSVFPITVPPLRDRPGDIPLLARYFVDRFCRDMKKRPIALTPTAVELLVSYTWPGNVRELQNCIERAVILSDGAAIQPRHLNLSFSAIERPESPPDPWAQFDLSGSLAEVTRRATSHVERVKIEDALREADNNKGRAAELLQVSYKLFMAKLREHRLD